MATLNNGKCIKFLPSHGSYDDSEAGDPTLLIDKMFAEAFADLVRACHSTFGR